jgi:glutathione S-transferase
MKLFYAPASPFARKARLLIRELGLSSIEEIAVNPFERPPALVTLNPLSKVPTLVLDDGSALYDSQVICEFLAYQSGNSTLVPPSGLDRWQTLRRHALANGILDQAYNAAVEINRRPEHERSPDWINRWCMAIERGLVVIDREWPVWGESLTLAHVTTACLLSYLDLRLSALIEWRKQCPTLASWHAVFSARPSMLQTAPPPPDLAPVSCATGSQ